MSLLITRSKLFLLVYEEQQRITEKNARGLFNNKFIFDYPPMKHIIGR